MRFLLLCFKMLTTSSLSVTPNQVTWLIRPSILLFYCDNDIFPSDLQRDFSLALDAWHDESSTGSKDGEDLF